MGKGRCVRWEIGNCRVAAYLNQALQLTASTPQLSFIVGLASGTGEVVTCTKIKKALKGIKALYETHTPTDTSRRL
jgi:hypothetical protein